MRKFEDPNGGDVNYVAFIQAIDEEYTGQVMETERERWEYTRVVLSFSSQELLCSVVIHPRNFVHSYT